MAGPWEKYQQAAPPADGPWARYQQPEQRVANTGPVNPGGGRGRRTVEQVRAQQRQDLMPVDPYVGGGATWGGSDPASRGALAVPEAAAALVTGAAATPIAGLAGLFATPFTDDAGGVVERVQGALTYQPRTQAGQRVTAGAAAPFEKLAEGADVAGGAVARVTGSPAVGAAVNTAIQSAPALLLRGRVGRDGNAGTPRSGRPVAAGETEARAPVPPQGGRRGGLGRVSEAAPSIDELRVAKEAAYKVADESGVVVSESALNRLKVVLYRATKGGNEKLYPKATAALQHILGQRGNKTLTNLEDLRKIANDAKISPDKADARLGSILVRVIDDFEEGITVKDLVGGDASKATAFKEARALNARLAKAETIDDIFKSARRAVGANYTVAGMETALRQKFRALADNKKRMRGFNADERAAIEQFIQGGRTDNFLRRVGKFAPDGVISGWSAIGAAAINPLLAAIPATGAVAKLVSTRRGISNANRISEMVRGGPLQAARHVNQLAEQVIPPR